MTPDEIFLNPIRKNILENTRNRIISSGFGFFCYFSIINTLFIHDFDLTFSVDRMDYDVEAWTLKSFPKGCFAVTIHITGSTNITNKTSVQMHHLGQCLLINLDVWQVNQIEMHRP